MSDPADQRLPSVVSAKAPAAPLVVRFEGVSKSYRRKRIQPFLIRDLVGPPRRQEDDDFWAVSELDIEIRAGESIAVLGENGSGKSTLLSLCTGATHPTRGRVSVRGRLAPVLELGVGFQMDMSAPENAYINASFLGLSRKEISERLPEILEFADLGEFVNVPLRFYSRGMIARLGFAVAVHVGADVLLVDEVLSVGDGAFQEKCFERIEALCAAGATLLFATHDLVAVQRVCTRAVWLRSGRVELDADAATCARRYQDHLRAGR